MSKIGKAPIEIPANINITLTDHKIIVKGEKGELSFDIHPKIVVKQQENNLLVEKKRDDKLSRSLHGLTKKIIDNLITGVTKGFDKKLEIIGVGYRAQLAGEKLVLAIGYSHPVEIVPPQGINFKVEKNIITVSGIDKQLVGQVAANIRQVRKPEPYKGKGIRYMGEYIKIKPGKAAKTGSA